MTSKKSDPSSRIFDLLQFGEFGDVNPSITDSATYTFLQAHTMSDTFPDYRKDVIFIHATGNPSNKYLADAIAAMEGTEAAWVTASGMGAITSAILQNCQYRRSYRMQHHNVWRNLCFSQQLPQKFRIEVTFVDITDTHAVLKAIRPNTKIIYTETMTNPLLQISDIPALAKIANDHGLKLIVDNTFTPMIVSPALQGAHIVVHSMTKFINGKNDCVAGAICGTKEFIDALCDVNGGTAMLLGPALDPLRSSSILKKSSYPPYPYEAAQ